MAHVKFPKIKKLLGKQKSYPCSIAFEISSDGFKVCHAVIDLEIFVAGNGVPLVMTWGRQSCVPDSRDGNQISGIYTFEIRWYLINIQKLIWTLEIINLTRYKCQKRT